MQLMFCGDVSIKITEGKVHGRNLPKNLCNRSVDSINNLYMLLFCTSKTRKKTLYGGGGGADLIFVWRKIQVAGTKKGTWRRRVSIPVPLACKASALPFELHPRWQVRSECHSSIPNFNYILFLSHLTISIQLNLKKKEKQFLYVFRNYSSLFYVNVKFNLN